MAVKFFVADLARLHGDIGINGVTANHRYHARRGWQRH
jgi:hypothetical protein